MKKFRLGVVGLGHRGRGMFKGVAKGIGDFEAVAACDLNPALWFEPTNSYYAAHSLLWRNVCRMWRFSKVMMT